MNNNYNKLVIYPENRYVNNNFEFDFKPDIKFLRIDIGLSQDATYSAHWLKSNNDRAVIGIEPHPYNINCILTGTCKNQHIPNINLNSMTVNINHQIQKQIKDRYILIKGAVDNVLEPTIRTFYSATPDTGNSSLIKENIDSQFNPNSIESSFEVPVFPLTYVLDKIDWNKFQYIEQMKIDTEGNEIPVILSCKEYIKKVIFLRVECWYGPDGYDHKDSATPMIAFLKELGFENINQRPGDFKFRNTRYLDVINNLKLECEEVL